MSDPQEGLIAPGALLKDRYRLERILGRGGMASVWLATDRVLERAVAVKALSDTIASDPEFLARFRREARVAAGVSHPNLIGVYDYADGAERPYLVMEYVPGPNLAERTSQGASIDCERLARELLGALAHIHAAGIVHRDIKPQNVLVAPDGSAKLIDFGIALPSDATSLTQTGQLLGTARYIAPEVMRGMPATERADLYSCGIVLADCLGGEPPAALRGLVESLSNAEPDDRPRSAEEALAVLGQRPSALGRPTRRRPAPEQPTEPLDALPGTGGAGTGLTRRGRGRQVALAVAVVAVAVVSILAATDGPEGEDGKADSSVARGEGEGATAGEGSGGAASVPEPAGSDPALGSALNQEGFELIQAGGHEEAIPVLEEAVASFPPGTEELDYAYALFNLGNALRLSGRPEEAIPVLERRLEIPNQTAVVRQELSAARREAR